MHHAERGLFELRRGRPLLITGAARAIESPDNPAHSDTTSVIVAAVEGLQPETLTRLREVGEADPRLVVTRHRVRSMGLEPGKGFDFSLGLNGASEPDQILRLASAAYRESIPHPDIRGATPQEAAGVVLARMGHLLPAVVAVPTDRERVPALRKLLNSGTLLSVTSEEICDLVSATTLEVVFVSEAPVPLEEAENAHFILFRESTGLQEHVAILVGDRATWPDPVPVRLHSACLTGDLFGSLRCDCGAQLRGSLAYFAEQGGGVLLYLAQEGRNIGLGNKLRAYAIQEGGLDTVDADCALGFGPDERRYDVAIQMLRHIGVSSIQLLTNNPEKLQALEEAGIRVVDRQPLHGTLNRHNLPYVRAKVDRAGHWLHSMLSGGIADRDQDPAVTDGSGESRRRA